MINEKEYINSLGKMLNKCNYKLMDEFVNNNVDVLGKNTVKRWNESSERVKKLTYARMVYGRTDMKPKTIIYATKLEDEANEDYIS